MNRIHPILHNSLHTFCLTHAHTLPHAHTSLHACTSHCTCTCTSPPSLSYLFTYLALLSGCIHFDSALFHSFSPIITNTPIHILLHYTLLHTCSHLCSHYASTLSSLCTHIETVPYPLIMPSGPHRAFVVIEPHSLYFMIAAAP